MRLRWAPLFHCGARSDSNYGWETIGATGFLDESVFPIFNRWEYDQYVAKGEVAYMRDKSALARAYVGAHPVEFFRLSGIRFVRFWAGNGTRNGSVFFVLHAVLTTALGTLGGWHLWQRRRLSLAALFLLPLIPFPCPTTLRTRSSATGWLWILCLRSWPRIGSAIGSIATRKKEPKGNALCRRDHYLHPFFSR